MPSAIKAVPIMSKKASANTLMAGWLLTNSLKVPAASIIMIIEIITAAIMMLIWSAMPTAVMTESSEKTISMSKIWSTIF